MIRSRLGGCAVDAFNVDGLAAQRKANQLQLRKKHVELSELRFARASQLASRNVDGLAGVAEVRGAHVFRIRIPA